MSEGVSGGRRAIPRLIFVPGRENMTEKRMKNVVIEVKGGVVNPIRIPEGVKLTVRDIDVGDKSTYQS